MQSFDDIIAKLFLVLTCSAVVVCAAPVESSVRTLLDEAQTLGARNHDDEALDCLLRAVTNDPDAELVIRATDNLYQSRDAKVRLTNCFTAALASLPSQRSLLLGYLGRTLSDLGEHAAARDCYEQRMPLTNWLIVGGFENAERSGLRAVFAPEENLARAAVYDGKRWPVAWRPAAPLHASGAVALNILQPDQWLTAYLRGGVLTPTAVTAMIWVSFDGAFRFWLNGQPAAEYAKYPGFAVDMHRIPITLAAGTNLLVFKLCMRDNTAMFACRLATREDVPLALPNLQPADATIPLSCGTTARWPEPGLSRAAARWQQRVQAQPDDAPGAVMLARYCMALQRSGEAIDIYERVRDVLETGDLLDLGRAYLDQASESQGIAMFRAALQQDPQANASRVAIGGHYLMRDMFDLALPILQEALMVYSNDPAARIVLIQLYNARGWSEDAYRLACETSALYPDLADAAQALAETAEALDYDTIAADAWRRVLASRNNSYTARRALVRLAYKHDDTHQALDELAHAEEVLPYIPGISLMRLQLYARLRDTTNGHAAAARALAVFPDNGDVYKYLGDLYAIAGARTNAITAYQTCLIYQPDYLWLRRQIDFMQGKSQAFFAQAEYNDEAVAAMIANAVRRYNRDPEVLTEIILRQHLIQLYADGSSRQQVHIVERVLQPRGVQNASSITLPRGEVLRAVTHKTDGRILESTHLTDRQIEFADVQVGDVIEYKYVINRYGGSWLDEHFYTMFAFDRSQTFIDRMEINMAVASNRTVTFAVNSPTIRYERRAGHGGILHQWWATNLPPLPAEPLSPPYYDRARVVAISTVTNWATIARWQQSMEADIMRGDQEVRRLARVIAGNATNAAARVAAVFDYITANFRYTQMYETDIAAVKPHAIPDILVNRCGDCKDLALLMCELLRALDVQAWPALVRTADRGRLRRNVPAPDVFNHVLVYIPALDRFCDPTFRHGAADLLPPECQDVDAFVLQDGAAIFRRTPLAPPDDNASSAAFSGVVMADGGFTGSVITILRRLDAAQARRTLETYDKRERVANYLLASIDPQARVTTFDIRNPAPTNAPLELVLEFTAPRLAQRAGDIMTLNLPLPLKTEEFLAGLEQRRQPLRLAALQEEQRAYVFTCPSDMRCSMAVTNRVLATRFGTFAMHAAIDAPVVRIDWCLRLTQREIPPRQYTAFRRFLERCADAAAQVVTFTVSRAATAP